MKTEGLFFAARIPFTELNALQKLKKQINLTLTHVIACLQMTGSRGEFTGEMNVKYIEHYRSQK